MQKLKQFRDQARGLSDLLNYAAVIEDGVVLCKDGSLLGGWFYRGSDFDSSTAEELNALSARINAAYAKLGNGWMIQTDVVRLSVDTYPMPEASFPNALSQRIDDERRTFFKGVGVQFQTINVLLVSYLPPHQNESKFYDFLVVRPEGKAKRDLATKHLEYFEQTLFALESDLSSVVQMSRIKSESTTSADGKPVVFDLLLQYLNFAVTGENHSIRLPPCPMYIDAILGWRDLQGGFQPKIGEKYISVISIDGFPQEGYPMILNGLGQLSCEYRWNTRFIFMDRQEALAELKSYRKKWSQKIRGFIDQILQTNRGPIDQNAISMVGELDEAISIAESGVCGFGYYTSVVVLLNEDLTKLEEETHDVMRVIQDIGFSCRKESINALEGWLGSLPSHSTQNVRRPILHTLNLSDLSPMTSIWSGEGFCPSPLFPKKSPPLIQAFTGGSTAFRLNLHVGDLGHFTIIGPPGSGKSTLMAFIDTQWQRYPGARLFAFDKGYSLFPLCRGVDGLHYDIAGDDSKSLHFCPLAKIAESRAEQAWAESWISNLCEYQGLKVLAQHRNAIHRAMNLLKDAASKTLTDFIATLQDKELREVLNHYTLNGAMGFLLDAEQDCLKLDSFQVFEIGHLMNLGDKNALPVLEYLFHRIETSLDGSPAILAIDEAWLALQHPIFKSKIREWLKVLRKANVCVGLATQSLSDLASSGIADIIAEACPTKFFLANPSAGDESSKSFYTNLGLNSREIEIIANMTPKRDYFLVQPHSRRVFQLALGQLALRWVGVSDLESIGLLKGLIAEYPETWKIEWENVIS